MEVSITSGSVTLTFGGVASYLDWGNGAALQPDNPSGVVLLNYSFALPGVSYQVLNPSGQVASDAGGDASILSTVPVGTVIQTLNSLVVMFQRSPRPVGWIPGRSSYIDESFPIVVVPYSLSSLSTSTALRPPAIGNPIDPTVRALRMSPVLLDAATLDALPSVVDLDTLPTSWLLWENARPNIDNYIAKFAGFCGELWTGWATEGYTPFLQHPGYGGFMSAWVSGALLLAVSTENTTKRKQLARLLAQWGLDLFGSYVSGRHDKCDGGHYQGRKALVVLAGHLLQASWKDVTAFLGSDVFNEDQQFFTGSPAWVWGWSYGYVGKSEQPCNIGDPISSWNNSCRYYLPQYFQQEVCGTQVGAAVAMNILGLRSKMGVGHFGMMSQWMQGPPASALAEMALLPAYETAPPLSAIQWGTTYAGGTGSYDFGRAAWEAYSSYGAPTVNTVVYSGPGTEAYRSSKFAASVEGAPAYVYGHARTTSHRTQAWLAGSSPVQSWFTFAADGTATVAITRLAGAITAALVYPKDVATQSIVDGVLYLQVPANTRLRIECNGDRAEVLHLHSAPLLPEVPGGVLDWSTWGQFNVASINTSTGTFSLGSAAPPANTRVRIYSDNGVYPTSPSTTISEEQFLYVVSPSGASLRLSTSYGGPPIDITSTAGVGNLIIYRTTADASTDLYFPPGDWRVGRNFLTRANRKVYTHGSAHIYGTIDTRSVTPWTLRGHGTWRGTVATWEAVVSDPYDYEMVLGRDDITFRYANVVDGATFYGYPYFLCGFGVHTWRNVTLINPWTYNADGFNISKHPDGVTPGRVTDCYAFVGDDAMYLDTDNQNDIVEGSFISTTNGACFLLGYFYTLIFDEAFAKLMANNHALTLVLSNAESGISWPSGAIVNCLVDAPFSASDRGFADATFDGLQVWGPLPNRFLVLENRLYPFDVGRQEDAAGQITRMTFRNITCEFSPGESSIIAGLDAENAPSYIAFETAQFGATLLTQGNFPSYFELDGFSNHITVDGVRVDVLMPAPMGGSSSLSANLTGNLGLRAIAAGTSSMSAAMSYRGALSAVAAGSSSMQASLGGITPIGLAAALSGSSSLSAQLGGLFAMSATFAGSSSMQANIGGGAVGLSAVFAGTSSFYAVLGIIYDKANAPDESPMKQRIFNALLALTTNGPYHEAKVDAKTGQMTVFMSKTVKPVSVDISEVEKIMAPASRYRRAFNVTEIESWIFEAEVKFSSGLRVSCEVFENSVSDTGITIPESKNVPNQRTLLARLVKARYDEPPAQNPSLGSVVRFTFEVNPSTLRK